MIQLSDNEYNISMSTSPKKFCCVIKILLIKDYCWEMSNSLWKTFHFDFFPNQHQLHLGLFVEVQNAKELLQMLLNSQIEVAFINPHVVRKKFFIFSMFV